MPTVIMPVAWYCVLGCLSVCTSICPSISLNMRSQVLLSNLDSRVNWFQFGFQRFTTLFFWTQYPFDEFLLICHKRRLGPGFELFGFFVFQGHRDLLNAFFAIRTRIMTIYSQMVSGQFTATSKYFPKTLFWPWFNSIIEVRKRD